MSNVLEVLLTIQMIVGVSTFLLFGWLLYRHLTASVGGLAGDYDNDGLHGREADIMIIHAKTGISTQILRCVGHIGSGSVLKLEDGFEVGDYFLSHLEQKVVQKGQSTTYQTWAIVRTESCWLHIPLD